MLLNTFIGVLTILGMSLLLVPFAWAVAFTSGCASLLFLAAWLFLYTQS